MSAPSYLVCATERSGSTLLCELLAGTGVAGRPEEFFEFLSATGRVRQPREYFPDDADPSILELLPPLEPPVPPVPHERRLAEALRARPHAQRRLGLEDDVGLPGATSSPTATPRRQLGPLRWVHVERDDTLAQAISLWRAVQTAQWRAEDRDAGGRARLPRGRDRAPQGAPGGAHGRLARVVRRARHRAAGDRLRGVRRATPSRRSAACSSTSASPREGVEIPHPPMRRQADARSQEWVDRFREEVPA